MQLLQGARFLYHIPELGPTFLTQLFSEMDVALSRDDRQAMDWLAVGKYLLCLFCGNIENARAKGLPVDEFNNYAWQETAAIYSGSNGTVALLSQAPHPNSAKVFINWLLSREGQTSFQKIMNGPDLVMESMRVDVPKDPIPPEKRRAAGVNYIIMRSGKKHPFGVTHRTPRKVPHRTARRAHALLGALQSAKKPTRPIGMKQPFKTFQSFQSFKSCKTPFGVIHRRGTEDAN